MKVIKAVGHCVLSLMLAVIIVGIPSAMSFDITDSSSGTDAVSSASLNIPANPDGEFVVLINNELHKDNIEEWKSFFSDEDYPVIFNDISCITARGDAAGITTAGLYTQRLPENQMKMRVEDPTLLVSKIEKGRFDTAIMSKELSDALKLKADPENITVINITGGVSDEKA